MARPLFISCNGNLQVSAACWMVVMVAVTLLSSGCSGLQSLTSSIPAPVEQCAADGCTLNTAYGLWPDRSACKAASVVYPTTEREVIAAVASAMKQNKKIKVSTTFGHSIPKIACPGSETGMIISSKKYTAVVEIDKAKRTVTAQGGILLRTLSDAVAAAGLALPVAPYYEGVSLAGLLSTGAHGSSLFHKGASLHEYVIGMRIVTPASKAKGYAQVQVLESHDEHLLKAARVSLGVLGVISTVTIQLEPLFKRSVSISYAADDAGMENEILHIANTEEFADVVWYPGQGQVAYRYDHRVPANTVGEGSNNYLHGQSTLVTQVQAVRSLVELADSSGNRSMKCELAGQFFAQMKQFGFGFFQDGVSFTGFPVIGPQHLISAFGGCQRIEAGPGYACGWDPRIGGSIFFDASPALPLRHLKAFIADVRALRAAAPAGSLCDLDTYTGLVFRFAKKQTAYMGPAQEDMFMVDITWTRGNDATSPRLDMDVFQELEQIAFLKYGGRPHWGKNRPHVFTGVHKQYSHLSSFLAVKNQFDPKGLFSSEWSDAILGLNSKQPESFYPGCAIEGVCRCKTDEHCAPEKNSFCRSGLVYSAARVCRTVASSLPRSLRTSNPICPRL